MTIKEIAKICNVSPATVSNVINGKNRVGADTTERILNIIKETGYKPNNIAKGLRTQSTKMIGLIVEEVILFNIPDIINGIMDYCEKNDYHIILENMRLYARWQDTWFNDSRKYHKALDPILERMESLGLDGIIYLAGHERKITGISDMLTLPTVMAYSMPESGNIPSFIIDDEQGGYEATKYLISKGHTRIGVIAGEHDNYHTLMRINGYQKALYDAGILYDPKLVEYTRWTRDGGYDAAPKMMKKDITAVFCMSDLIASGVYDYCRECKIQVGDDLSLIGYDNHEISDFLNPKLTTIALPLYDIGARAAKKLIDILENKDKCDRSISCIVGNLIERESVNTIS